MKMIFLVKEGFSPFPTTPLRIFPRRFLTEKKKKKKKKKKKN